MRSRDSDIYACSTAVTWGIGGQANRISNRSCCAAGRYLPHTADESRVAGDLHAKRRGTMEGATGPSEAVTASRDDADDQQDTPQRVKAARWDPTDRSSELGQLTVHPPPARPHQPVRRPVRRPRRPTLRRRCDLLRRQLPSLIHLAALDPVRQPLAEYKQRHDQHPVHPPDARQEPIAAGNLRIRRKRERVQGLPADSTSPSTGSTEETIEHTCWWAV